ncbi:MAG: AAA family ATPase [Citrobacter freundii]|nr:MAG: AAA family ATPase [Citrobacter freundii]
MEIVFNEIVIVFTQVSLRFGKIRKWLGQAYRIFTLNRSARLLTNSDYLDQEVFYFNYFKIIPCKHYIGGIDIEEAFKFIKEKYAGEIVNVHQSSSFNKQKERHELDKIIIIMDSQVMVALDYSWADIFFPSRKDKWADRLVRELNNYRLPPKEEDFEMSIISGNARGLILKSLPLKQTSLDLNMLFNDDFIEVNKVIKDRLEKTDDKGIVLLHGLPGTGKTTYLRHLVGSLKKKVMFVSPSIAEDLMRADFIDLLIDNPNSILVIEDAENIITDRRYNSRSSVSSLLNISDGLLSDCLNVQIICTFNNPINLIDPALLRKGRLIARYEFDKLSVEKAQILSDHLGFDTTIMEPMTLAEVARQNERPEPLRKIEVIGFRRQESMMN